MSTETTGPPYDREDIRVTTVDGQAAIEVGDVTIRLHVHVTEWTHDSPRHGESVDMDVEVEADEFAWWTLYPARSDVTTPMTEQDFPKISIEPEELEE